MEIAGVAAAGITFGALILKLSKWLYKSAKKITYARRELMKLAKEMGIFADLYEDFYRVCVSDQRKKGRDTSSVRSLIDWIEDAIDAFRKLRKKVQALAGDSKYSMRETLTARVKWFFSENEVKYLRLSLTVAQESMRGFSNITVIETINEEIQLIRAVIAQGDRQDIQVLEDQLGATLHERLVELEEISRNRRAQKRAINSRMQEAADVLEQKSMIIGVSAIVPESNQLFVFATVVEKYAKKVQKQYRTDTTYTVPSRQQPARADSFQPTNSTASDSFVSKPSSYSEPVTIASPAASTEELDKISNPCGKCTGVCVCSETESRPFILTRPSSPGSARPTRPVCFEHPSHRFDRSWQQPTSNNTAYHSTKGTCPASDDDLWQTLKEVDKPDPETERTVKEPEELIREIDANRRKNMEHNSSRGQNDEEYESDDAEEEDEVSEEEAQMSPFQPVAGVRGKFPRNWRTRHERSGSLDDHWRRKL